MKILHTIAAGKEISDKRINSVMGLTTAVTLMRAMHGHRMKHTPQAASKTSPTSLTASAKVGPVRSRSGVAGSCLIVGVNIEIAAGRHCF